MLIKLEKEYNRLHRQEWATEAKETKRIILKKEAMVRRGKRYVLKLPRTQYDRFAQCFMILEGEEGLCSFIKFNHEEDTITFEMYEKFRCNMFNRRIKNNRQEHIAKMFTLENINKIIV